MNQMWPLELAVLSGVVSAKQVLLVDICVSFMATHCSEDSRDTLRKLHPQRPPGSLMLNGAPDGPESGAQSGHLRGTPAGNTCPPLGLH